MTARKSALNTCWKKASRYAISVLALAFLCAPAQAQTSSYDALIDFCLVDVDRSDHSRVLSRLRHCVHLNSLHAIDAEYRALSALGVEEAARRVLAYGRKENKALPHMDCSRRSILLDELYRHLGYQSRMAQVSKFEPFFPSHIIVDVANPDTGRYEMQDATYDVFIIDVESRNRLGVEEIISAPLENILPCQSEMECGWDRSPPDGRNAMYTLKPYWGIGYFNWRIGEEGGPLIYNPDKFDLTKKLSKESHPVDYCMYRKYQCDDEVLTTQKKPPG